MVLNMHAYHDHAARMESFYLELSPNKQKGLRALQKRNLWNGFTALYDFSGLWDGLLLGNMEGHLATHLFEEMGRNVARWVEPHPQAYLRQVSFIMSAVPYFFLHVEVPLTLCTGGLRSLPA